MISINWPSTGAVLLVGSIENTLQQAMQHAKSVLSENSVRSMALFDSHAHPDFQLISPETDSKWIKIDQIRALVSWGAGKPQISAMQIAIIAPADQMNLQAANALLKTLEEPSFQTLIILVTDRPSFLPATIRSRCYWIRSRTKDYSNPPIELKMQLIKDLNALCAKEIDPVSIGIQWMKQDPKQVLHWLLAVLNEEMNSCIAKGNKINNPLPWRFLDNVLNAKRALEEPNQPNIQLLIESLLIEYTTDWVDIPS